MIYTVILMLSFVLHNFTYQLPFLLKTQKQVVYSKRLMAPMLMLFVKEKVILNSSNILFNANITNPLVMKFWYKHFTKKLFLLLKNLVYKHFGLMTNQLVISYNFHLVDILLKNTVKPLYKNWVYVPHSGGLNTRILNTITTVSFSFQNKVYKTLMFYIFNLLLIPYVASLNEYELRYSYIVLPHVFELYLFINYFYFRINNF